MILLNVSNTVFAGTLIAASLIAFLLGVMLRKWGRDNKREEREYWQQIHAATEDYPEDAQLHNGNIPDYKKAK